MLAIAQVFTRKSSVITSAFAHNQANIISATYTIACTYVWESERPHGIVSTNVNSRPTLSFPFLRSASTARGRKNEEHTQLILCRVNYYVPPRPHDSDTTKKKETRGRGMERHGATSSFHGGDAGITTEQRITIAYNQDTTHSEILAHIQG